MISTILAEKNRAITFKHGSALSKINVHDETFNHDLDVIARLYHTEAEIFLSDMKLCISPNIKKLCDLITNNFESNRIPLVSKYNVKLIGEVELFTYLQEENKLDVIGNGLLPKGAMLGFPLGDITDVKDLFITGNTTIDEYSRIFLSKYSDSDLVDFWNKYMLDFSGTNTLLNELDVLHFRNVEILILLYLATYNILNNKVRYTNNLTSFENNKVNIRDFINTVIKKYNSFITKYKDINLILNYRYDNEADNFVIYLSGDLYNDYLNQYEFGIEGIIGFIINSNKTNGSKFATIEDIVKDGNKYLTYYNNNYKLDSLANARNNIDIKKSTLKVLVTSIIDIVKDTNDITRIIKLDTSKGYELLAEFINNIKDKTLEDPLKLSSKIFNLFNNEIGKFIVTMEGQKRFLSGTEDMSKEAALYAILTRLLDQLFEDTSIVEVK